MDSLPNVILLMTDQHRADALGCMGNAIVRTPNFDRLAARGVVFENAFVQSPVCMASRAAIHTGRYPRSTRVRSMGLLPPEEITLAEALKRAGYVTGTFGKLHLTSMGYTLYDLGDDHEIDDARPFLEPCGILTTGMVAAAADPCKQRYGFDVTVGAGDMTWGYYLDWLQAVAPEHVKHHCAENWGLGRAGVQFGDSPPATRMFYPPIRDFFDSHLPAEVHPSRFIVEQTLRFIRANRDRPFFAHCSFVDPHHPFNAPPPYNRLYDPADMPVPAAVGPERWVPPGMPRGVQAHIAKTADSPPELWQWALANYYGMISHVDACVGRLLDGLETLGLADNTLIVFIADHGEYAGDHRMLYKGSLHFDSILRVPFVVSWGSRLQPRRIQALVQEIDVYPTVMALLGLPSHAGVQGRDLSSMLLGGPEAGYHHVTCELDALLDTSFVPSQTIRTAEWKLEIFPVDRTGLLFDLRDDPAEQHNLFFDPGYAKIREELTFDLLQHRYETKDPLPIRLRGA
ncbi:MAG: sulfatase-like hydrolase/transferase [Chloroflexi bacterium]|nr:sulfatase-like hydrolase/transferase [Chloroflexota bacterium]